MCVALGAAVSREVLEATDDAEGVLCVDPEGAAVCHAVGVGGEASLDFADDRACGVDVDVGHGCKVEVDAQETECLSGKLCVEGDGVVAFAGAVFGGGDGGEPVASGEARHFAAFLVDADEERGVELTELGAEALHLYGVLYVASASPGGAVVVEEDDAADVVVAQSGDDVAVVGGVDVGAAEADEQHHTDVA